MLDRPGLRLMRAVSVPVPVKAPAGRARWPRDRLGVHLRNLPNLGLVNAAYSSKRSGGQRGQATHRQGPDSHPMSAANPEGTFQARRKAIRDGLVASGVSIELAEQWCDAWETEATRRGLPRDRNYWLTGALWITERRSTRKGIG